MYKKKKGLSSTVTTVLLIVLVISIVSIIFFWFRGMVEEGVTKFGQNIKTVCEQVSFKADYDLDSGTLQIVNEGNVPIYNMQVKITSDGNYETIDLRENPTLGWPQGGLKIGATKDIPLVGYSNTNLEITPVLAGTSNNGKKYFICGGQYGKILEI